MNEPYKRKLIEVALPLEAINVASAREKSIRHGHPSTLHLWWARRPLAACRAVLFASLVDDPSSNPDRFPTPKAVEDERTRLFGIIERLVLWENTTNEAVLDGARAEIRRSTGGNPPPVLDPFCGGGSIPLEAQRLGLTAYASDLNPVAVLITKALIEIPPKFANRPPVHPDARRGVGGTGAWKGAAGLAEDVRRYGAWMRNEAERRIGHLYPKVRLPKEQGGGEATVIAWIWARTVICLNPACGVQMPLVRSFDLSTMRDDEAWIEPIVDRPAKTVRFEVRAGRGTPPEPPKVGRGAQFRCLVCEQVAPDEHIKAEGRAKRMDAQLMAIVAEGQRGRIYLAPTEEQETIARSAQPAWGPEDELPGNARWFSPPLFGMTRYRDLFTARQLVALTTFSDLVGEARERVLSDALAAGLPDDDLRLSAGGTAALAYADSVAAYLAFLVDRLADRSSSVCSWDVREGQGRKSGIRNVFARQAIPMSWDFAEASPFSEIAASVMSAIGRVADVLLRLPGKPSASASLADARSMNNARLTLVSSDPPYYDNIGYADLSDFFYVWLRRSLGEIYPNLFGTLLTPKSAELVATPYRFGGDKSRADAHFEQGLGATFARIHEMADPSFPVTIYYAFKQAESEGDGADGAIASTGWETMLEGLLAAGFAIDGTWPMRSELGNRMIASGTNALASSIVLVCRPRHVEAGITTRRDFVANLKREMPEALRTLQHGNIAPVDLAQASIGPGMAIFSRYAKVLEPDGSAMRVRTALALINQVLDELLTEQEGEYDADTRWAIAWYEQFGLAEAAYGTAETLSRAKDTSVAGLVEAGIVAASRGRARLLARNEYLAGWDPAKDRRVPVWEATQRLVQTLLTDGEASAGDLLARLGGLGDTARDLAYRMYHVAERKGWTDEARAYNALVVAWTDLSRGAESARAAQPAQASLGLE
jgi:putative DNA methylase